MQKIYFFSTAYDLAVQKQLAEPDNQRGWLSPQHLHVHESGFDPTIVGKVIIKGTNLHCPIS